MTRIANYVLSLPMAIFVIFSWVSCNNDRGRLKNTTKANKITSDLSSTKNKLLLVKGDSLKVAINGGFVTVAKNSVVDNDSVYTGIYRINNNSINQIFSTQKDDIVYFTTYASVGMGYRGYLYAFDVKRKKFLTNYSTKENYIFSSGGIFFLDKDYILSVCYPNHEDVDQPFTTDVEVYRVKQDKFHYIKYVAANGDMIFDDTLIIKLYNQVIKYGGGKL